MTLIKADRVESQFNGLGLRNREARDVVDLCFEEKRASLRVDGSTDFDKSRRGVGYPYYRALSPYRRALIQSGRV